MSMWSINQMLWLAISRCRTLGFLFRISLCYRAGVAAIYSANLSGDPEALYKATIGVDALIAAHGVPSDDALAMLFSHLRVRLLAFCMLLVSIFLPDVAWMRAVALDPHA